MPVDVANFLARNSPRFNPTAMEREQYQNALMRGQVRAQPQQMAMNDQLMQMREQGMQNDQQASTQQQQDAARGIFGRYSAAIAQSQSPLEAYRRALADPGFTKAATFLGLPQDQLVIGPEDSDESIRQQATDMARAMGQGGQTSQQRVHSTFVGKNGTQWYLTADGNAVDTGVPASQFAQRPLEAAGALVPFNPATGTAGAPIATAAEQNAAAAARKGAEAEAVASVVPADTRAAASAKAPRLAAAERRLQRVAEASQALGSGGGPIEGRLRNMAGTPAAQELEAANAQLINELTALTRIPGVGSQSDLEQRLAQLQLPNATQHPAVRERSIQELNAFLGDLGAAINGAAQEPQMPTFQNEAEAAAAAAAGKIKPGTRISVGGVTGVWQ